MLHEVQTKIGSFWRAMSLACFRSQHIAWLDSGYMFSRQFTDAVGANVDSDLESSSP